MILGLGASVFAVVALTHLARTSREQRVARAHERVEAELERLSELAPSMTHAQRSRHGRRGLGELRSGYLEGAGGHESPWVSDLLRGPLVKGQPSVSESLTPDGTSVVAGVLELDSGEVAWAAQRVVVGPEMTSLRFSVVCLSIVMFVMVLAAAQTLIAFDRGAGTLRQSVVVLAKDLHATVPRPKLRELAEVADGLDSLARELSQAQEDRVRLMRELSEHERWAALGRVVAGVAHEVRNPLAAIKLRTDLADATADIPPAVREDLALIGSEVARLDRLVRDLLLLADRKSKDAVRTPTDLAALTASRAELLRPWAETRGVTVVASGHGSAGIDADAVTRALDNLLRNAVEATPSGGSVVATVSEDATRARLVVEDPGAGVLLEDAALVFEPFFTTKPDRHRPRSRPLPRGRRSARWQPSVRTRRRAHPFHPGAGERLGCRMGTVLIVDDEPAIRDGLARAVGSKGHRAVLARGLVEARAALTAHDIDCLLLDMRLEDGDGLELLREMRAGRDVETPVIMATAYGDSPRAIAAMKAGAFEYVTKPFDLPLLLDAVERAVKAKALARGPDTRAEPPSDETLIGSSAAMLDVWKVIGRAAASDVPVLIVGETGTGKDLVARAIHENSARAAFPFVPVNLASLSANLIESELMGHEKGAFTGAVALRKGRLEKAASGTLFLDEIGDLDASLQTKLLRVLQDGRFERVGGSDTITSDARIIAATHKEVRPGQPTATLREDLYYRLAVIEVAIPPLRARKSDIPLLVAHALRRTKARAVSEEAMTTLYAYDWPGNVRELIHVIERAAVMCSMEVIDTSDLPPTLRQARPVAVTPGPAMPLRDALAALEKQMIVQAIEQAAGNRAEAARILGIARPQLYTKLDEHGLSDPKRAK